MTKNDFLSICNNKYIDPKIVLENKTIHNFLAKNKDNHTVNLKLKLNTLIDIHF
jgi:hypothetical protein